MRTMAPTLYGDCTPSSSRASRPGGPAVPLPVQALEVGRAELPHGRRHLAGSGSPASTPARLTLQPSPCQPGGQRVAAQVAVHHQPGLPLRLQPRQPGRQQLVQGGLADPDRRVGPDARRSGPTAGTSSGRTARTVGRPRAAALRGGQGRGPGR